MYWHGFDSEGRPNLVWRAGRHDPKRATPERHTRYMLFLVAKAEVVFAPLYQYNVLFDCSGVGWKQTDKGMLT